MFVLLALKIQTLHNNQFLQCQFSLIFIRERIVLLSKLKKYEIRLKISN